MDRRNGSKPVEGIDTYSTLLITRLKSTVEMEVSPLRALTRPFFLFDLRFMICRNGSKPVEGIDTHCVAYFVTLCIVEMEVSPLRALTHDVEPVEEEGYPL